MEVPNNNTFNKIVKREYLERKEYKLIVEPFASSRQRRFSHGTLGCEKHITEW